MLYDSCFTPGRDLVDEAFRLEPIGQLDSARKLCLQAGREYDVALAMLSDTSETWALGKQLRDWADFNANRFAQKIAMTDAFKTQKWSALCAIIVGAVFLVLGIVATVVSGTPRALVRRAQPAPVTLPSEAVTPSAASTEGVREQDSQPRSAGCQPRPRADNGP